MSIFNYIFPIFAFGLIITGIVFLGLQQAADWAKDLTLQKIEEEKRSQSSEIVSTGTNSGRSKAAPEVKGP